MKVNIIRKQGNFTVDVDFTGAESGVTALYGPSGAGKTSVINMVSGLISPDKGHISVKELCLFDSEKGINLPTERRRIGYVFQDARLFPHMSVKNNLAYGLNLTPSGQRFVTFDPVVDLLGIGHLLNRRPSKLSGGEKQRVAIGRALLTSPAILLMDEPLASLDSRRKTEVLPFIMRLSREYKIPILYVSHLIDEILNLADKLVIMDSGRVLASGNTEDLFSRPDVQKHLSMDDHGSVVSGIVDEPCNSAGLTQLRFGSLRLTVPPVQAPKGMPIRVRIAAKHVAIALKKPEDTSFHNIFKGKVHSIVDKDGPFVDVYVDTGHIILARISRDSCCKLDLHEGKDVFILIKTVAVS
ncbi:MAG: molybdenum ABC transporter ATP-binding protein, partial [Deltaproteobacteria bacterium]|nr:molybdenum ABC transporter ATP-binding protein [Deltaproteobacteria bacterium]